MMSISRLKLLSHKTKNFFGEKTPYLSLKGKKRSVHYFTYRWTFLLFQIFNFCSNTYLDGFQIKSVVKNYFVLHLFCELHFEKLTWNGKKWKSSKYALKSLVQVKLAALNRGVFMAPFEQNTFLLNKKFTGIFYSDVKTIQRSPMDVVNWTHFKSEHTSFIFSFLGDPLRSLSSVKWKFLSLQ